MGRRSQRQLETTGAELDWKSIMTGVAEDAAGIDVPVLLLRGGASDVLSGDAAEELMRILRHGRLETVEKAGHLAAGDNPHSTVGLVKGFLAQLGW
jgi:pimeloyl-ACP methyl ester carboxylesterase